MLRPLVKSCLLALLLGGAAWSTPLEQAQRELKEYKLFEAAHFAHGLKGFPARAVEIEALAESERVGEAWAQLRKLPHSAYAEPMFYVLRGDLSGLKGDVDSTQKDFAEALKRAPSRRLSKIYVLSRACVALSRCKQPELARQRYLEALRLTSSGKLTRDDLIELQWAQVWMAYYSPEPDQGLAALAVLDQLYTGTREGGKGRVLVWRALFASQAGNMTRARRYLDAAFEFFLRQPNRYGLIYALRTSVNTVIQKHDTEADRRWLRDFCLRTQRMEQFPEMQFGSYLGLAGLAAEGEGDYVRARELLLQAWKRFSNPYQRIYILTSILALHQHAGGEPTERIHWLEERWRLLEKLGPRQPEDPLFPLTRRELYLSQLAECYLHRNPARALLLYQEARTAANSESTRLQIVRSQLVKGSAASAIAVTHEGLQESLKLLEATHDPQERLSILEGLVGIAASRTRLREMWDDGMQPRPESATGILRTALLARPGELLSLEQSYQTRIDTAAGQAQWSGAAVQALRLSELLLIQGRYQEAVWSLDRGIAWAERTQYYDREASLRELRARLLRTLGRIPEALGELKRVRDLYLRQGDRGALGDAAYADAMRAFYLRRQGYPLEAIELTQRHLADRYLGEEDRTYFLLQQAQALADLHRYAEACGAYARALTHTHNGLLQIALRYSLAESERLQSHLEASLEPLQEAWKQCWELHSLTIRDIGLVWGGALQKLGRTEEAREVYLKTARRLDELAKEYPVESRSAVFAQPLTRALADALKGTNWTGWSSGPAGKPTEPVTPLDATALFLEECNQARSTSPAWDALLPIAAGDFASLQTRKVPLVQYVVTPHEVHILAAGAGHLKYYRRRVEQDTVSAWLRLVWESTPEGREARQNLYRLFVDPWAHDFGGGQIGILPTADLWYLPWSALQNDTGEFLCKHWQLSVRSPEDVRSTTAAWKLDPGSWLLVGGVADDLPESLKEVDSIHSLFGAARLLRGQDATRKAFLENCQDASLIHLASHSSVSPGDLNRSSLLLSDGKLPLTQLYGVKLAPGALVVMSSCRSAVGGAPGKEVGSLADAWRVAGASQIIASLRPVEDEATRHFFEVFFARLKVTASPGQALRSTQEQLSRELGEEGITRWAPFLLFGRSD